MMKEAIQKARQDKDNKMTKRMLATMKKWKQSKHQASREMRAAYSQLRTLNAELIGEYNKRANNHEQLLAALKDVNHMIQKAARLRFGPPKQRVVSRCRAAIKSNNIQNLFSIIKSGNE